MTEVPTIIGPTASGKTRVCLELGDNLPIEVISVDSRQIYRYMDIGTGKPTLKEREKVIHHLIDLKDPDEKYSAYKFAKDCRKKVKEIQRKGHIPIICGGTILYIRSIYEGLFPEPNIPGEIREEIRKQVEEEPLKMHKELTKVDPMAGVRIHPNDKQRIARALEIYRVSGIPISEHWKRGKGNKIPLKIHCLLPERSQLYENIEKRVGEMFRRGFVEEVRKLLDMGYDPALYSFTSLGYREIAEFILKRRDGNIQEIRNEIVKKTKEYATRQITFIKGLPDVTFYKTPDILIGSLIEELKN
jgi:tRNA dimethylallyltransferase